MLVTADNTLSDQTHTTMDYTIPSGMHAIPEHFLDLRTDEQVDKDLQNPLPVSDEKNIWFFWHSGFEHMHPYTKRNIRAWHRRFSKAGWVVRVLNRSPSSVLNVANFLDMKDPSIFPKAFVDGTIGGDYAPQHTSDLVRWPLLLRHGGVYADAGFMQIGDLDRLWNETIANPASPYEIISNNAGPANVYSLTNYFFCSGKNNPLFARAHKLLIELWNADGGRTSTDGMHASPLLRGVPLLGHSTLSFEENGRKYGPEECSRLLSDYIIQGHALSMAMGIVDEEDNWNGPEYVSKHVFAIEYTVGSQLINEMTAWNGPRAFELMSLSLPTPGETESSDQKQAREIVEACLQKSFSFKLAHGIILRMIGQTLGSLWRKHEGSDNVPGTYAHWLRQGMIYWNQDALPQNQVFEEIEPFKRGPLLREVGENEIE